MPEKYTLKFDYYIKEYFENYLEKTPDSKFKNIAEFLRTHIISLKKDIKYNLYNLKINKEIIGFFKSYLKSNLALGYLNVDEFLRDIIRKKMEELRL